MTAFAERATRRRENRLFTAKVQLRDDGGDPVLDGYASVTDSPYDVRDWLGDYTETITRGAFAKSLAERDDVRLLFNHDGLPLARTSAGTLHLGEDDRGLHVEAPLDRRSSLANDVMIAMERGDLREMSFAFAATRQEWNEDYTLRTIREVRLYDVSVVTYPANDATTVKLRNAQNVDEMTDDELRELVARANRRLAAPAFDADAARIKFHAAYSL